LSPAVASIGVGFLTFHLDLIFRVGRNRQVSLSLPNCWRTS